MGGACDKNQGDRLAPPISHMESDLARVAAEIRAKPRPSAPKTVRANLTPNEDEDEDEEHPMLERMGRSYLPRDVEDDYELIEQLGEGQFAKVFKAEHRVTGQIVAIKMICRKETGADVQSVTDKEIMIMRNINHQNCVRLHNIYQTEEQVQLVMELLEGRDLFDRITQRKKFPENTAKTMLWQICSGVKHLHDRHIIHRDLKPENILLESEDSDIEVKVADFGLSKIFPHNADAMQTQTRCGTPGYVAPEVLNSTLYCEKIDTWAMGVIAYMLLCGHPPFPLDMKASSLKKVNNAKFSFPSRHWHSISNEAQDLIKKMIVIDVQKRLSMAQVLDHPWFTNVERSR